MREDAPRTLTNSVHVATQPPRSVGPSHSLKRSMLSGPHCNEPHRTVCSCNDFVPDTSCWILVRLSQQEPINHRPLSALTLGPSKPCSRSSNTTVPTVAQNPFAFCFVRFQRIKFYLKFRHESWNSSGRRKTHHLTWNAQGVGWMDSPAFPTSCVCLHAALASSKRFLCRLSRRGNAFAYVGAPSFETVWAAGCIRTHTPFWTREDLPHLPSSHHDPFSQRHHVVRRR